MARDSKCEVCAAHDKALEDTPYKALSCPNCGTSLGENGMLSLWSEITTVIADTYDRGTFEKVDIYKCHTCGTHFTLTAVPVIWNANHDIYYRHHPGEEE